MSLQFEFFWVVPRRADHMQWYPLVFASWLAASEFYLCKLLHLVPATILWVRWDGWLYTAWLFLHSRLQYPGGWSVWVVLLCPVSLNLWILVFLSNTYLNTYPQSCHKNEVRWRIWYLTARHVVCDQSVIAFLLHPSLPQYLVSYSFHSNAHQNCRGGTGISEKDSGLCCNPSSTIS